MASSEHDVIKLALVELGQLSNLDHTRNTIYEAIQVHFPITRDSVLRSYRWNFATKLGFLPPVESPTNRNSGLSFPYRYNLPADYLVNIGPPGNIIPLSNYGIGEQGNDWKILGRLVHSNMIQEDSQNTKGLWLYYIFRETEVSIWDPLFIELLSIRLALKCSFAVVKNPSLAQILAVRNQEVEQKAKIANSLENSPQTFNTNAGWIDAHYGFNRYGANEDNYYRTTIPSSGSSSGGSGLQHHSFYVAIDTDQTLASIQNVTEFTHSTVRTPTWSSGNRYILIGIRQGYPDIERITQGGVNVINTFEKVETTLFNNQVIQWWRTRNPQNLNASGIPYGVA